MKKIVIISVSIVCVVLIGLAIAGGPGGGWHRTPEEKVEFIKSKIVEKLDLDDSQKLALNRIGDEIITEHQQMEETHQTFKASFMDTLKKENVTADDLKALFDTKKPVIDDIMQLAAEHIAEFHSILTPEQRETLIAEIESHEGRRCRFFR
jgi:periplasmic protein CpxP/Spy